MMNHYQNHNNNIRNDENDSDDDHYELVLPPAQTPEESYQKEHIKFQLPFDKPYDVQKKAINFLVGRICNTHRDVSNKQLYATGHNAIERAHQFATSSTTILELPTGVGKTAIALSAALRAQYVRSENNKALMKDAMVEARKKYEKQNSNRNSQNQQQQQQQQNNQNQQSSSNSDPSSTNLSWQDIGDSNFLLRLVPLEIYRVETMKVKNSRKFHEWRGKADHLQYYSDYYHEVIGAQTDHVVRRRINDDDYNNGRNYTDNNDDEDSIFLDDDNNERDFAPKRDKVTKSGTDEFKTRVDDILKALTGGGASNIDTNRPKVMILSRTHSQIEEVTKQLRSFHEAADSQHPDHELISCGVLASRKMLCPKKMQKAMIDHEKNPPKEEDNQQQHRNNNNNNTQQDAAQNAMIVTENENDDNDDQLAGKIDLGELCDKACKCRKCPFNMPPKKNKKGVTIPVSAADIRKSLLPDIEDIRRTLIDELTDTQGYGFVPDGVHAGMYMHEPKKLANFIVEGNDDKVFDQKVWDVKDMVEFGTAAGACPYYTARELVGGRSIIFAPYNYACDIFIRKAMKLGKFLMNSIVIVDEAHNIPDMFKETLSVSFGAFESRHILSQKFVRAGLVFAEEFVYKNTRLRKRKPDNFTAAETCPQRRRERRDEHQRQILEFFTDPNEDKIEICSGNNYLIPRDASWDDYKGWDERTCTITGNFSRIPYPRKLKPRPHSSLDLEQIFLFTMRIVNLLHVAAGQIMGQALHWPREHKGQMEVASRFKSGEEFFAIMESLFSSRSKFGCDNGNIQRYQYDKTSIVSCDGSGNFIQVDQSNPFSPLTKTFNNSNNEEMEEQKCKQLQSIRDNKFAGVHKDDPAFVFEVCSSFYQTFNTSNFNPFQFSPNELNFLQQLFFGLLFVAKFPNYFTVFSQKKYFSRENDAYNLSVEIRCLDASLGWSFFKHSVGHVCLMSGTIGSHEVFGRQLGETFCLADDTNSKTEDNDDDNNDNNNGGAKTTVKSRVENLIRARDDTAEQAVLKNVRDTKNTFLLDDPYSHVSANPHYTFPLWKYLAERNFLRGSHVINVKQQTNTWILKSLLNGSECNNKKKNLDDDSYVENLAHSIISIISRIPHGTLIFCPNYGLAKRLDATIKKIRAKPGHDQILDSEYLILKDLSTPEKDERNKKLANNEECGEDPLEQYRSRLNDELTNNRYGGAALISVYRGRISEGVNLSDHLARGVICIGIPLRSIGAPSVQAQKSFFENQKGGGKKAAEDWYHSDAVIAVNQAIGRGIRGIRDYASIFLLDTRYSESKFKQLLPAWLQSAVKVYPPSSATNNNNNNGSPTLVNGLDRNLLDTVVHPMKDWFLKLQSKFPTDEKKIKELLEQQAEEKRTLEEEQRLLGNDLDEEDDDDEYPFIKEEPRWSSSRVRFYLDDEDLDGMDDDDDDDTRSVQIKTEIKLERVKDEPPDDYEEEEEEDERPLIPESTSMPKQSSSRSAPQRRGRDSDYDQDQDEDEEDDDDDDDDDNDDGIVVSQLTLQKISNQRPQSSSSHSHWTTTQRTNHDNNTALPLSQISTASTNNVGDFSPTAGGGGSSSSPNFSRAANGTNNINSSSSSSFSFFAVNNNSNIMTNNRPHQNHIPPQSNNNNNNNTNNSSSSPIPVPNPNNNGRSSHHQSSSSSSTSSASLSQTKKKQSSSTWFNAKARKN